MTREFIERIAVLEAENAELRVALKGLSDMYTHAWDLVDGGLIMMEQSVLKFEAAHERAHKALGIKLLSADEDTQ